MDFTRVNCWTDGKVWFRRISSSGSRVKIWLNSTGPPSWAFRFAVTTAARRVYPVTCWASVQPIITRLLRRRRPIWPAAIEPAIRRFINFHRIRTTTTTTSNSSNNNNNNNNSKVCHTNSRLRPTSPSIKVSFLFYFCPSSKRKKKKKLFFKIFLVWSCGALCCVNKL